MSKQPKTRDRDSPMREAVREFLRHDLRRSPEQDDICQDAILRALAVDDGSINRPLHYLYRIARNLFVDSQRRRQREQAAHRSLPEAMAGAIEPLHPERIVAARQELMQVSAAIDALPPRCREAFLLHRFERLSYSAIARRMGISTGTVEKHIALAMLRIAVAVRTSGNERCI